MIDGFIALALACQNYRIGLERFCRALQSMQSSTIETNRRLMKAGKIEFDEYEEADTT